jgi:hypothetical protein
VVTAGATVVAAQADRASTPFTVAMYHCWRGVTGQEPGALGAAHHGLGSTPVDSDTEERTNRMFRTVARRDAEANTLARASAPE